MVKNICGKNNEKSDLIKKYKKQHNRKDAHKIIKISTRVYRNKSHLQASQQMVKMRQ
jgi:hypothetical protein